MINVSKKKRRKNEANQLKKSIYIVKFRFFCNFCSSVGSYNLQTVISIDDWCRISINFQCKFLFSLLFICESIGHTNQITRSFEITSILMSDDEQICIVNNKLIISLFFLLEDQLHRRCVALQNEQWKYGRLSQ